MGRRRVGAEAEALKQEAAALLDGCGLGGRVRPRRGRRLVVVLEVVAPAAATVAVGVVVGGGGGGAGGGEDPVQRLVELLLLCLPLARQIQHGAESGRSCGRPAASGPELTASAQTASGPELKVVRKKMLDTAKSTVVG